MIELDKKLLQELLEKAADSGRRRFNYDLRTSPEDGSQRMLNVLLPGTCVAVHRHSLSNENVLCLLGRLDEIIYDDSGHEIGRVRLDPSAGKFGCVIPVDTWHTVEVHIPSVIYEAKDGKYGQDGTEYR